MSLCIMSRISLLQGSFHLMPALHDGPMHAGSPCSHGTIHPLSSLTTKNHSRYGIQGACLMPGMGFFGLRSRTS